MISIIRKLEICELSGIGDDYTIELSKWLNKHIGNLIPKILDNGDISYSLHDNIVMIVGHRNKKIHLPADTIYSQLNINWNLSYRDSIQILSYFISKVYNISSDYKPTVDYYL